MHSRRSTLPRHTDQRDAKRGCQSVESHPDGCCGVPCPLAGLRNVGTPGESDGDASMAGHLRLAEQPYLRRRDGESCIDAGEPWDAEPVSQHRA